MQVEDPFQSPSERLKFFSGYSLQLFVKYTWYELCLLKDTPEKSFQIFPAAAGP